MLIVPIQVMSFKGDDNQSSMLANDDKSNVATTLSSLLLLAPFSLPPILSLDTTLAIGGTTAYTQSRAVQDAALMTRC
jgi:hypothetical protein